MSTCFNFRRLIVVRPEKWLEQLLELVLLDADSTISHFYLDKRFFCKSGEHIHLQLYCRVVSAEFNRI